MTTELAKQIVMEVLRDRTKQYAPAEGPDDAKLCSVLADTHRVLAQGAQISIHLLLGHANCKETERELCEATQTLEVWTFKMQREVPYEAAVRPPVLPLFLCQAVRSQLHFSPFRSWLIAQKDVGQSNGLCPLIRVSTASDFATRSVSSSADWLQCHQFPPCLVRSSLPIVNATSRVVQQHSNGEHFWLQVRVHWLNKEHFLTKAPICPKTRLEQQDDGLWMLPLTDRCHGRVSCASVERSGEDDDTLTMSGAESDDISSECLTPNESPSPIVRRKTAEFSREEDISRKSNGRKNGNKVKDEKSETEGANGIAKTTDGIAMERRKTTLNVHRQQKRTGERLPNRDRPDEEMEKQDEQEREEEETNNAGMPMEGSRQSPTVSVPAFNFPSATPNSPQRARPTLCSDTTPMLRKNTLTHRAFVERKKSERKSIETQCPQSKSHQFDSSRLMSTPTNSFDNRKSCWRTPSRFVCNFEESILNGRIPANNIVDGFHLQLTIINTGAAAPNGSSNLVPASKRLTLPVLTYFFNDLMSQIPGQSNPAMPPSPLHLAHCELDAMSVPIPRRCTLQIVLLRPCGSVVKLFMVDVDVLDMPSSSRTFIRQRILSDKNVKETGEKGTGSRTEENGNKSSGFANVPNAKTSSESLRFLIHLRLASDASGQVYLHSDIRILFSNKANDLEGLGPIIEKANSVCSGASYENMRSMAQMPQKPKYSPIK